MYVYLSEFNYKETRKNLMEIIKINDGDKRKYMGLLLLADEQESMIDKYLERGEMFVLNDNGVKSWMCSYKWGIWYLWA